MAAMERFALWVELDIKLGLLRAFLAAAQVERGL